MGHHTPFRIDDLVSTKLSYKGRQAPKAVDVGTPTLNTPPSGDVDPMEWLHNPVGLDAAPRSKVSWEDAGEIISPSTRILATAAA